MVFPVVGGNESKGYEISNSLRFNDDDSASLSRAFSTDPSDQKLTTISFWFKIGNITSAFRALYRFNDGSNTGAIYLRSGDDLQFAWDVSSGSLDVRPDGVLRDPSAWYHCHIKVDTTQGTAANRVIIHINGVERSYGTATYPNQNATLQHLSNGKTYYIGGDGQSSDYYFDGYVTEFHVIDGQAKDYTDFGEFDDNGVWIPKKYTGSYGTNGFYLQFKQTGTSQNASGIGADTSGNGNHFAVSNLAATDVTTDSPTNNFCTLNPLTQSEPGNSPTFAEGNLKITMANFDTESVMATMGVTQGKWYWEVKGGWTTGNWGFGIEKASSSNIGFNVGYTSTSYSFSQGGYKQNNSSASQIDSGLGNTDIIGYALDLDNGYFNFSQNGVWYNGSASESTTFDTSNHDFTSLDFGSEFVMPTISGFADTSITTEINFGNPTFAISSGNADANGYGSFEYAPPSGYYALCTKNLAEFG